MDCQNIQQVTNIFSIAITGLIILFIILAVMFIADTKVDVTADDVRRGK